VRIAPLALVLIACGSAQEPAPPPEPEPIAAKKQPAPGPTDDLVRVQLLADATRVAAGQELTIGARFDIEPGWHLYWSNPGESGLPTELELTAPPGFVVGPVRYPGPMRFESPGSITSYGYDEMVMLSAIVTAPDRVAGPARFEAQLSWLACREICVPGKGRTAIELPAATASEPAAPAHAELFARNRETLPLPFAELGAARPSWQRDERQTSLKIHVPKADRLEYFPPSPEDLALIGQASVPAAGGARLELAYKPSARQVRVRGVLAVTRGQAVRYYAMDFEESPP
jgi:DsbC/DsbD-like thiol-disulfide interchange protein